MGGWETWKGDAVMSRVSAVLAFVPLSPLTAAASAVVTWTEMPDWAPPVVGHEPCSGDLDGDGGSDLVVAQSLSVMENTGSSSSPAWLERPEWSRNDACFHDQFSGLRAPGVADLDGDGDLDLVAAPDSDSGIRGFPLFPS